MQNSKLFHINNVKMLLKKKISNVIKKKFLKQQKYKKVSTVFALMFMNFNDI